MRKYEVEILVTKKEIFHVDAEDDADLVKECQFSHLQKKSNNVKHIETKNEIRQLSGWSYISNVRK